MESVSILHWVIVIVFLVLCTASPILGIVRGVRNSSVLNALLSFFIPAYGLIYFFAAKRRAA